MKEASDFSSTLRQALFLVFISFTNSIEIVEGYRRRYGSSHSSSGGENPLADLEWWEITLIAVGAVVAVLICTILGQLCCSTECQEECCDGQTEEA